MMSNYDLSDLGAIAAHPSGYDLSNIGGQVQQTDQDGSQDGILSPAGRSILKGAAALGLGVLQGGAHAGYGLADLLARGASEIPGVNLTAPKPNVLVGPAAQLKGTGLERAGEFIGQAAPAVATGGMAAEGFIPQAIATGGIAAATQPGGLAERGIAGALGAGAGGVGHILSQGGLLFTKGIAKKLESLYAAQKGIGKGLYDSAFSGTHEVPATHSLDTHMQLQELLNKPKTDSTNINYSIRKYLGSDSPTVEDLHFLKSSLGKSENKVLGKIGQKAGLTDRDTDTIEALGTLRNRLGNDLQTNMNRISPEKGHQYAIAQTHWRDNVIPFEKSRYTSLRKLFGSDREVTPGLFRDLSKDAVGSQNLRRLLGTDASTMRVGRILHSKLSIPAPLLLAGGGYYGLRHLLGKAL